jgi:carbon monoxide dehydrogenase subunit G
MGLSRLDNFLKSVRGNILYVDPNNLDSTDSVENQGNSPTRPFKTIQRALIEAARFSYQVGNNNDRFSKTTIKLQPGEHIVDNRPGIVVKDDGTYITRGGFDNYTDFSEFNLLSNFDVLSENNQLYKLNSIYGGVIVPRGTSIKGSDLRKTKIIPRYVPNPDEVDGSNINRSAVFRVTGGCFIYGFTIFDADINALCYKDFTINQFVPDFSHHKLTCFEYVDGVNNVKIDDTFISDLETTKTDLDMYYDKISVAYGQNSGREIDEDDEDIETVVDEYRIVGSRGAESNIASISASGTTVTVTLEESLTELSVNSPIQISGVASTNPLDVYDGQYLISSVISDTQFTYISRITNVDTAPSSNSATVNFSVDTVTSASPYIFNVSLRSVYGMCGMHADGNLVSGFKSMVVAQFTGIGLQKDDNAFIKYNEVLGEYEDSSVVTDIHTDSRAVFKPSYRNYHIKASNNAIIQLVSIFAIGYAEHFVVESGGDHSITNSNSNFGAKSLVARGFRKDSFPRDDRGYITHFVSPQKIKNIETSVEFLPIDVGLTTSVSVGVGTTTRLYIYNETNQDAPPSNVVDGYRIGAKENDILYAQIAQSGIVSTYSCRITMPESDLSKEKSYDVSRVNNDSENDIDSNGIIGLTTSHELIDGEKVRVFSDNGHLPDGLINNNVYYVITDAVSGITSTEIKLASTLSDVFTDNPIIPNSKGGNLKIISKVTDKSSGDVGHPIQFDQVRSNWYLNVSETDNTLYDVINNVGVSGIGEATSRTYVERTLDTRNLIDTIYKVRYVLPKNAQNNARPPLDGYIIQESNTTGLSDTEISNDVYFGNSITLTNSNQLRNPSIVADVEWSSSGISTVYTELPHNISVGSEIKIENIVSAGNTTANSEKGFNGEFKVTSVLTSKKFTYALTDDPGNFQSDTTVRDSNLPKFTQKSIPTCLQVYRSVELQPFVQGKQDGIYQLFLINNSNSPTVSPFQESTFSQPVQFLYPQLNRDNPNADPKSSRSFALSSPIGQVVINNPENSLTKESIEKVSTDLKIGIGITGAISSTGTAHTIFTEIDHGLSGITSLTVVSAGSNYIGEDTYYAADLVGFAGSITGSNANVKVDVTAIGQVGNVVIMDPGSSYGIGHTLQIIPAAGIGTTTGFTAAVVRVDAVTDYQDLTLEIDGLSEDYDGYNNLYKVTGITSSVTEIEVESANSVTGFSTTAVDFGNNLSSLTGKLLTPSSVTYNNETGVGIVTFASSHGLNVDNSLLFVGFDNSFLNKIVSVTKKLSLLSVEVEFGINDNSVPVTGSPEAYLKGNNSRSGRLEKETESNSGRNVVQYGGIESTITTLLSSDSGAPDQLVISDAIIKGFRVGDYLQVDREIFRIKSTVNSNTVGVFRSLLGSQRQTHDVNSVVKKIIIKSVEFRRNSIIRASGHTFEYLGFGPGNYSTAFPERQDRVLSPQEELISQSTKENGGIVIFTAMNSDGDFYTGNKKVNSATGKEEVFDTPVPTVTGEEIDTGAFSVGFDVISPLEISVSRSLRVEGGDNSTLVSEFDGPVVFNEKITSTSDKGIEATSLFLQGDADISRKITVGLSTPTEAGNYGDAVIRTEPEEFNNVGWIYTKGNEWKQWGWIKDSSELNQLISGVGIATTSSDSVGLSTRVNISAVGDINVSASFDSLTKTTNYVIDGTGLAADNEIDIYDEGLLKGAASAIDFKGAVDGFGVEVSTLVNSGIATITFDVPINEIDFGAGIIGQSSPSFATTSIGTRIIYENLIDSVNTNYAVGIEPTALWHSLPQSSGYSFKWYGGITEVAELIANAGSGQLQINGGSSKVTAGQLESTATTGTAPFIVGSSTTVTNLNANFLQGFVSSDEELENTIVRRDATNKIEGNATKLIHVGTGQTGGYYTDIPARLGYNPFNRDAGDTCAGPAIFQSSISVTGGATLAGLTTVTQVSDIYKNQSSSAGTLTCDFTTGPITRTTSTDITIIDITNVPTTDERSLNYSVLLKAASPVLSLENIVFKVNGTTLTEGTDIYWLNNLSPVGTDSGYYFLGFTILRVGTGWEVLATYAPYGS